MKKENPAKEHYQRLRRLSCEQLWRDEVPAFDRAEGRERFDRVAVVRAVGVVFSESGTSPQKEQARQWLRSLLHDPLEKIRRYAMTALPKISVDRQEEAELLTLLEKSTSEREREHLSQTLAKIGGNAALEATADGQLGLLAQRKVRANVARHENSGAIRLNASLADFRGLQIHLHCRAGLAEILADEVIESIQTGAPFRLVDRQRELVIVEPIRAFRLADIYQLRCFSAVGVVPSELSKAENEIEAVGNTVASPPARRVLEAFTAGPIRYRLEFVSRGHQRGAVRQIADRVYAINPALLNDPRNALWQINVHDSPKLFVELTPRLRPDPRYVWRVSDVPAASHPALAACMARLAGPRDREVVWDPFCGSGLELIERTLRGGVRTIFGTDHNSEALAIARRNLAAASKSRIPTTLVHCDFRDYSTVPGLRPGTASLIITNPPLGRRVPIPDLSRLIEDLFRVASTVLIPGGRLVFVNPLPIAPGARTLDREFRREIDLGGFHAHLEKYVRTR
ncbi:MAG: methyltransferase [Chthoniobacteraceae bacterium]